MCLNKVNIISVRSGRHRLVPNVEESLQANRKWSHSNFRCVRRRDEPIFVFMTSNNSVPEGFNSNLLFLFHFLNQILLKKGPPADPLLSPHIQSICEALDIPHLETRFDIDTGAKEFSINLYPQQKKLNDAILESVKYLNWTRYAIIYEGNYCAAILN